MAAAILVSIVAGYKRSPRRGGQSAALNDTLEQRVAAEIQERMQAEEAFRQAQRWRSSGSSPGASPIDFNNLLQVIMGNLDALRRRIQAARHCGWRRIAAARRCRRRADSAPHSHPALAGFRPQAAAPARAARCQSAGRRDVRLLRASVGDNIEIELVPAANVSPHLRRSQSTRKRNFEPCGQCPRCDAGRRQDNHRDRQRLP